MKKLALLLTLSTYLFTAQAQESAIGLKGGLNYSTYKFISNQYTELMPRVKMVHFGLFVDLPLSDKVYLQPELMMNFTGFESTANTQWGKVKIDYFSIPVMLKYWIAEKVNIHAGPELGVLLAAKWGPNDLSESLTDINFIFDFGSEYYFNKDIGLSIRYSKGLKNIEKEDSTLALKSDLWQFSMLIKF